MTFNDYGAFYEEKSKFLRLDQQHTSMMVQISRKKVDGERDLPGLGNTKKDQVSFCLWIFKNSHQNWANFVKRDFLIFNKLKS